MIRDLLRDTKIDSVTSIFTKKGAVRGNHFHALTTQWVFIVSGILKVATKEVIDYNSGTGAYMTTGAQRSAEAPVHSLHVNPPMEAHAWLALEDTECLVFTHGPRSGDKYETDTIRLRPEERLL